MKVLRKSYLNMKKIIFVFLILPLVGCATNPQQTHQNIKNTLNNTWSGYEGCMSSLNSDSNVSYMHENILIKDDNPNKYEILKSTKLANKKDRDVIINYNLLTKFCRDTLISELFKINPAFGSLITKMRSETQTILDAYAIEKISLGELNQKNAILIKNMEKDYFDTLANISNHIVIAEQDSNNRLNYLLESLRRGVREDQLIQLERQRLLRQQQPVTTNCNSYGNTINCTSR